MNIKPLVYGSIISPYTRKVIITLNRKNIPYELKQLTPFNPADKQFLLTLNPLGKVPIYQEDDFVLADSSAICAYLDKTFPEPAIFPQDHKAFARSLWLEEFADTQLFPALGTIFLNTILAPILNRPANKDIVDTTLKTTLPSLFDYLETQITNTNYIVGDQLSIADISIGQLAVVQFDFLDFKIDISKWKRLSKYIDHIAQDNLFKNVFAAALERLNAIKQ